MTYFKAKFNSFRFDYLLNFWAVLALISQILYPGVVHAFTSGTMANSSQKFASELELAAHDYQAELALSLSLVNKPDKVVKGIVSVYSSTPDQTDDSPFYTANGKHVYDGLIAANGLPFGTKIKIPAVFGDKIFTVDDRMNARYDFGHFDVWMDAPKSELFKFGVKRVQVEIYYPEKVMAMK